VAASVPLLGGLVAGCASSGNEPRAHFETPTPALQEGPPPTTAPPATTEPPPPPDLAAYLAKIPHFGAAPAPQVDYREHYTGEVPFFYEIRTTQPVAFLTMDDGAVKHPMALALLKAAKIPVTLFLTSNFISDNKDFFKDLRDTGYATIENHTIWHPDLTKEPDKGKYQLCTTQDTLTSWYGNRPTLFRPPFGNYDGGVLAAAHECGIKAGFYWRETVDAGNVYYQRDTGHIHAGDIILMHFRPAFPDDFVAALNAIKNSGLIPARLEDYVGVGPDEGYRGGGAPANPPATTSSPPTQATTTPPDTTPPTTDPTTAAMAADVVADEKLML
jgi:peptidoglycan/xylan/chitin deacetylase (PgdA/CDA1 family)